MIDAHQHFWRYSAAEFPWIDASMEILKRDFLPEHAAPAMQASGITRAIAVQARPMVEETDWLLALADANPAIAGVVGWADFFSADFQRHLEKWSAHPAFRGLRPMLQDMPNPQAAMLHPVFNANVAALQAAGKSFDLLLKSSQLPGAAEFCARHPNRPIILNHGGKPNIAAGEWESWRTQITQLAKLPHVACKLSGLVTEADWRGWPAQNLPRYAAALIDIFGPHRILFGSDWPVCTLAADYSQITTLAAAAMAGCTPAERTAMFGGNAIAFYNPRLQGAAQEP